MTMIGMIGSQTNRTVVLVHGAWHGGWCWAATQAELDKHGIASLAPDRPGHGASTMPLCDMYGDAAHIRAVLATIPGEVVLVGHSYGGSVITEAAIGSPNVKHLVYLCAFALMGGESRQMFREIAPPVKTALDAARIISDNDTSSINPELAEAAFYAHCPPGVAQAATARLQPQRMITFQQPVTETSWARIPTTYVICTKDAALSPSHQEILAKRVSDAGGTVLRLDTDHSPFASMPVETADILVSVARI
jgi:pimeloyl-ACP methyl ester carboxylesterase